MDVMYAYVSTILRNLPEKDYIGGITMLWNLDMQIFAL